MFEPEFDMAMNPMVLLAVAAGCGLTAMVGVQQVMSQRGDATDENKVKVLVAREEVQAGTPLSDSTVAFKLVERDGLPEGVITDKTEYEERASRSKLYPGQYVLKPQLGEKGEFGASMEIPKGMRVVTVAVNATMTHSGLLSPGDRVDVQVVYKQNSQRGMGTISKTKTVLQNIQVWATDKIRVGHEAQKEDLAQSKNVSLLAYPGQAALLKLAESRGDLTLLLRGRTDTASTDTGDLDEAALDKRTAELFNDAATEVAHENQTDSGEPKIAPPTAPTFIEYLNSGQAAPETATTTTQPQPTWKVEIFNGQDRQVTEFEITDGKSGKDRKSQPVIRSPQNGPTAGSPTVLPGQSASRHTVSRIPL